MSYLIFNEENHPELLGKPLKGKYLTEFVKGMQDNINILFDINSRARDPKLADLIASQERLKTAITKRLDSNAAVTFGIDANDLGKMIRKATGLEIDDTSFANAMHAIINASAAQRQGKLSTSQVEKTIQEGSVVEVAVHSLTLFSQCIALQEGKEAEYLAMAQKGLEEMEKRFYWAKE